VENQIRVPSCLTYPGSVGSGNGAGRIFGLTRIVIIDFHVLSIYQQLGLSAARVISSPSEQSVARDANTSAAFVGSARRGRSEDRTFEGSPIP
jgi:hypothetical protein